MTSQSSFNLLAVEGLGLGVWGLGRRVEGLGEGLGLGVWGLECRV